jgi:5-methylcytosine-specific restriction protein A
MPVAPARACPRSGCPQLQPCPDHAKGETHAEVSTARPWSRLYDTQRWKRLSAKVRQLETTCRACYVEGRPPKPSRHVDHIVPHRGDLARFYDRTNVQALCAECHSAKTRREQRT